MSRILSISLCLLLAALPLAAQGAASVSLPDTLDSRAPVLGFLVPAGSEAFHYADTETLRWTIDEQSWGGPPAAIVLTELVDGSLPVPHVVEPDPDGQYAYAWTVPALSVHGDLEARLSLKATDRFGWSRTVYSDWFQIIDYVSAVPRLSARDDLGPISPNPFNPRTTISFRLEEAAHCQLTVFDVRGRQVASLLDEDRAAGEHQAAWLGQSDTGQTMPSGLYFARLKLQGENRQKSFVTRLTLVK